MANEGDTEGIILATQKSVIKGMREVVAGIKKDIGGPGLTWPALEMLLDGFENKTPTIIRQEREL